MKIRDIVFDIGRVLVDFSYDDLFSYLFDRGIALKSIDDFAEKTNLKSYEYGHISSEKFIDNICRLLTRQADRDELTEKWVKIFEPITEMLAFASSLKGRYNIFLLSNISALHWDYLMAEYKLDQVGMGVLVSFEAGALKPEEQIFREAEKRFGLLPGSTLFIDDKKENVDGAIACGWQAIHHRACEETKLKVYEMLSI